MTNVIFIGTFDPLHGGHVGQLLRAHRSLSFSKVYIGVTKYPSHKPHTSSWQDRVEMARLTLGALQLPFTYVIRLVESPLAPDIIEKIDYKITGIDSLIEDLTDSKRWVFAQRWPMIVLSIPSIAESRLTHVIADLPKNIQQTLSYKYVSGVDVPMMNYNFEQQAFIAERVHATYLRSGQAKALIPLTVQRYIKNHKLY